MERTPQKNKALQTRANEATEMKNFEEKQEPHEIKASKSFECNIYENHGAMRGHHKGA